MALPKMRRDVPNGSGGSKKAKLRARHGSSRDVLRWVHLDLDAMFGLSDRRAPLFSSWSTCRGLFSSVPISTNRPNSCPMVVLGSPNSAPDPSTGFFAYWPSLRRLKPILFPPNTVPLPFGDPS